MFISIMFMLLGFLIGSVVFEMVKRKPEKKNEDLIFLENRIVDMILESENEIQVGDLYRLNDEDSISSIEAAINDLIENNIIHIELRTGIIMFVYGWIE